MQQFFFANVPLSKMGECSGIAKLVKQMPWENGAGFRAVAETIPAPLVLGSAQGNIAYLNKAFVQSTGYTLDDIPTMADWLSCTCPDQQYRQRVAESWQDNLEKARHTNGVFAPMELDIKCKDGTVRTFMVCTVILRDSAEALLAILYDITSSKVTVDEVENLAFYDPLTYLPNRRFLLDRLHQALVLSNRSGRQGALLFIDLDNFKSINDTHGHAVGDLLLVETANRLQSSVRASDTIIRLGADEFAILLENMDNDEYTAAFHAETVGEKICNAIGQPYLISGYAHNCTACIGITLFHGAATMEEMLKRADSALCQAKKYGRNTLRFFDPVIQAAIMDKVALETDLRRAVSEQRQFLLYYQAQVDAAGRLVGAEALVRWLHPVRGIVPPAEFIPLAEESGLILPLGHWVLTTACQQLAAWAAQPETAHLTVAVNVSARQFHMPTFVDEVMTLLNYFGADPAKLKLEITESMMIGNVDDIIAKMTALKARGVSFSMDDFGTGYSSLQYLKRLPLNQLKIDQSFVREIATDVNDKAMVCTIIAMAQSLNLNVIAEGVETEAQRQFLLSKGCTAYQGYLFGRPVPIEQFGKLLEEDSVFDGVANTG